MHDNIFDDNICNLDSDVQNFLTVLPSASSFSSSRRSEICMHGFAPILLLISHYFAMLEPYVDISKLLKLLFSQTLQNF